LKEHVFIYLKVFVNESSDTIYVGLPISVYEVFNQGICLGCFLLRGSNEKGSASDPINLLKEFMSLWLWDYEAFFFKTNKEERLRVRGRKRERRGKGRRRRREREEDRDRQTQRHRDTEKGNFTAFPKTLTYGDLRKELIIPRI
jgi:hypothetical protein